MINDSTCRCKIFFKIPEFGKRFQRKLPTCDIHRQSQTKRQTDTGLQLQHSVARVTAQTSCTKNAQQIAVMELQGQVDRLVVNSHDSSIVVQVSSTSSTVDDDDEIWWQRDQLAVAKFSKSAVWDKVPERSTRIFGDLQISLKHTVG